MKKSVIGLWAVLIVCTAVLLGCSGAGNKIRGEAGKEYSLTVMHTNDHHGAVLQKNKIGGLAERASIIKEVKASAGNVLVLDAGDINTGTAVSNMFSAEPDIKAYNAIGYDAVALGNHEFDGTQKKLEEQIKLAEFPFVSANVKKSNGKYLDKAFIIKDYEGFRVGVFGLTTLRTKVIASPDKSLKFIDEITAAKDMVSILKTKYKADIIICIGHLGSVQEAPEHVTSVKLAESVPGIDLIIDGHSHSKMENPIVKNNIPIVSAHEWGKVVGKGRFMVKDGKVTSFNWIPVPVDAAIVPDADISALLNPYIEKANASLKTVIGKAASAFEFGDRLSRKKEIALGNLVSDGTMWYIKKIGLTVDFAFHNGGNIRTELPAGNITKEHVATVLPFDNYIYVISLKGQDVIDLFNFIGSIKQGAGSFAQVSEQVRYTITYDDAGSGKISDITIGGKPIDPAKMYKIATNDYLANGGDGYIVLKKSVDTFNTSMTLRDAIIEYVQQQKEPLVPTVDGRIKIVGGMTL